MTAPEASAESLLGLPEQIDGQRAAELSEQLIELWRIQTGRLPDDLAADLDRCRAWFDPVAQGQRLRKELAIVRPVPTPERLPAPPLTYLVGEGKALITPEGRCAIELLRGLPRGSRVAITDELLYPYDRILGRLYRTWSRHRLNSVAKLLAGSDKPLQISAAAVVIALLVNRCTSEERALIRFASSPARDVVDAAFFPAVKAFHDTLVPRHRPTNSNPRLISGWMMYEAKRRLGDGLVVTDARYPNDGRVWIRPEHVSTIIRRVAGDLVRGHRVRASPATLGKAFDALVAALRAELPKLAGYGLVHERPTETSRLRTRLIESLPADESA